MSDKVEEEIFLADILDCKSASVGGPFFFNSKSVVSAKKSIKDRRERTKGRRTRALQTQIALHSQSQNYVACNELSKFSKQNFFYSQSQRNKPDYIKLQGPIISL